MKFFKNIFRAVAFFFFKLAHNGFGLGEVAEPNLNRITKLKN